MFIAFLFQKNLSYVDENIVELYQGKSILILHFLLMSFIFRTQNIYRICFRGHSFKQKVAGNITNQLFTIISVLIFTMFLPTGHDCYLVNFNGNPNTFHTMG